MEIRPLARSGAAQVAAWVVLAISCVYRWHSSLGNPAHVTDFQPVWRATHILLQGGTFYGSGRFGFVYLPSCAVIFLPFRLLSLHAAASLSIALQLAALTGACAVIVRAYAGPRIAVPISALVIVLSEATLSAEIFGNIDLYIPLAIAAMVALTERDARWAGVAYGLSVAIKPLVVIPGLIGLARRRWSFVASAIGAVLVLCVPAVILTDVGRFFTKAVPFLVSGEPDRIIQVQSIAVASVLRHDSVLLRDSLRFTLAVLGCAAVWSLWRRTAIPESLRWLEATAAGQLTISLAAGFAFSHHLATVLLLIPASVARAGIARRPIVMVPLALLVVPRAFTPLSMQAQQCISGSMLLASLLAAGAGQCRFFR